MPPLTVCFKTGRPKPDKTPAKSPPRANASMLHMVPDSPYLNPYGTSRQVYPSALQYQNGRLFSPLGRVHLELWDPSAGIQRRSLLVEIGRFHTWQLLLLR